MAARERAGEGSEQRRPAGMFGSPNTLIVSHAPSAWQQEIQVIQGRGPSRDVIVDDVSPTTVIQAIRAALRRTASRDIQGVDPWP